MQIIDTYSDALDSSIQSYRAFIWFGGHLNFGWAWTQKYWVHKYHFKYGSGGVGDEWLGMSM